MTRKLLKIRIRCLTPKIVLWQVRNQMCTSRLYPSLANFPNLQLKRAHPCSLQNRKHLEWRYRRVKRALLQPNTMLMQKRMMSWNLSLSKPSQHLKKTLLRLQTFLRHLAKQILKQQLPTKTLNWVSPRNWSKKTKIWNFYSQKNAHSFPILSRRSVTIIKSWLRWQ